MHHLTNGSQINMSNATVTAIISSWKRNSIEEILQRLVAQTHSGIVEVIVWQNENRVDLAELHKRYKFTHIHSVNKNWKFHSRFALPLLVNTDYCIVLDDDTLPNKNYIKSCIDFSQEHQDKVIITSNGRDILDFNDPSRQQGYEASDQTVPFCVDFGGHSWFFKTEIVNHMWCNNSRLFYTGEDIEFCASAAVYGDIKTYVFGTEDKDNMSNYDRHKWGVIEASSSDPLHGQERSKMIRHWLGKGWQIKIVKKLTEMHR